MIKTLFNTLPGGVVPFFNPSGFRPILDLDARNITGVAFGGNVNSWPDVGSLGANAIFNGVNPAPLYSDTGTMFGGPPWPGGQQPVVVYIRGIAASLRGGIPIISDTNGYTFFSWYFNWVNQETVGGAIFNGGPGSRPMLNQNTDGLPNPGNFFGFRTPGGSQALRPVYTQNHFGVAWRFAPSSLPAAERFCDVWVNRLGAGQERYRSTAPHGLAPADTFYDLGFLFDGFVRRFLWFDRSLSDIEISGVLNWGKANYGV